MIDKTAKETAALQSTLKLIGECVAEIGIDKPLSAYTKEQILTLAEVVVTAYYQYMINNSHVDEGDGF